MERGHKTIMVFFVLSFLFCGCLSSMARTYGPDKNYKMKIRHQYGQHFSDSGENVTLIVGSVENTGFETMYHANIECIIFDQNSDQIASSDTYLKDEVFEVGALEDFAIYVDCNPSLVKKVRCGYSYVKNP